MSDRCGATTKYGTACERQGPSGGLCHLHDPNRPRKRSGPFGGETGETLYGDGPSADECCEDCEWLRWELSPYPAGEHGSETVWLWREGDSLSCEKGPPGCIDPWAEVKP